MTAGKLSFKRQAVLWTPVVLWCAVIFLLSAVPSLAVGTGPLDFLLRKCAHLFEYAVLAFLLARAFAGSQGWPKNRVLYTALICAVLYACTDEYHQTFVGDRVGTPRDVLIDAVGAWIGTRFFR